MTLHQKANSSKHKKPKPQSEFSSQTKKTLDNLKKTINRKTVEELAHESNLIQRISSKIFGYDFLACMLIASLDPEHATLVKISDILHSLNKARIKPQSIMERLNKESATCFFKCVFEEIFKNQLDSLLSAVSPDLLKPFSKILIQDSSSFDLNETLSAFFKGSGGRASKATAKIDVIYDFKAKKYEHIKLTDHSEADQKLGLDVLNLLVPNSLVIRDLGYLRMDCIIKIDAMRSFFLSRFKNNTCVFLTRDDTEQLDLADYLYRNFKNVDVVDIDVFITQNKVPVRLIAYRVPPEVSEKRRRIAHAIAKKQGRTLTQKNLTLLDFSLFLTNVPRHIWKPDIIGTIYRIRWQIELLFKSWKSGLKIDYLKGIDPNRIRSLIYVRMILILIFNEFYKLLDYVGHCTNKIVSMDKVFKWMKSEGRLKRILAGKLAWWEERYLKDLVAICMCKGKKNAKTSLQRIYEHEFYYEKVS